MATSDRRTSNLQARLSMNLSKNLLGLSVMTSLVMLSTIVVPVGETTIAQPERVNLALAAQSNPAHTQIALDRLIAARKQLARQVSNCNGGDIQMWSCPGNVLPAAQSCQEPIAPCEIVEALTATDRAIATLDRYLHPSRHQVK